MAGLSTASPVETILDKENFTLEELLDEDEIIQECKALDGRLINSSHANTNFDRYKKQDLQTDAIAKKDGDGNCVTSVETINKKRKKKKRSGGSDSNAVINQPGSADKFNNAKSFEEILTNDLVPELNVTSKEKKKSKKCLDTIGQGIEQVSSEVLKEPADDIACEPQLDKSNKKCKNKKKKKSKLDNAKSFEEILTNDLVPESNVTSKEKKKSKKCLDTIGQRIEQVSSEVLKESADDIACEPQLDESNKKCKNKKKKKSKLDNAKSFEEILTNDLVPESNVTSKEKKKSKKSLDTIGQGIEQVSSEVLKEPADDIACEPQLDESNKKCKNKKKKKSKLVSETLVDSVEHHQLETEDKSKDFVSLEGKSATDSEMNKKSKDKKKKKDKPTSDSLVDNVEQCSVGDRQGANATKFKDVECSRDSQLLNSTMVNTCDILSEEKNVKSKGKKRKKDGLVSESLPGGDTKELDNRKLRTDSKNDDFQNLEEDATNKETKGLKKRKRLASEENDSQPIDKVAIEECKRRKTEGLEEIKVREQLMKVNASLGSDGHAGNKSKEENGKVGLNDNEKTSNGNLQRNGEKYAVQKTLKKQHNGSVEPKTINAFQRVKVDEVVFVDEKLQDNSYWAKDGAEIGYGAKAQEVLGQVRGRDFRHEKTKKKRGSYRGGQIGLQSHSVKFNYSDDE